MRNVIVTTVVLACLAACASVPKDRAHVTWNAPRVSEFRFDDSLPLSAAGDFAPWATLTADNTLESAALETCLDDRDACATGGLVRYRRMLELAAGLSRRAQLELVHEYFNRIDQTLPRDGTDRWSSLYRVASTQQGDCKAIALGKYFTLRRLGWRADDLRVVMNWDGQEQDWHALLAAQIDDQTYILDSILGLQRPRAFGFGYMVYSISEKGIWDYAPGFVPVP